MKIHDVISITHFESAIDPVDDPYHRYKIPVPKIIIKNHEKSEKKITAKKNRRLKNFLYYILHGRSDMGLNTMNGSLSTV